MANPLSKVTRPSAGGGDRPYQRTDVPYVLLAIFLLGTAVVIGGGVFAPGYRTPFALLWAFGCCVSGMLLGFLFAIPRVLPAGSIVAPVVPEGEGGTPDLEGAPAVTSTAAPLSSEINSNLVEVSDWLTKIIVGVGLVELKELPGHAASVARFVAPGLGAGAGTGVEIAAVIFMFFGVLGFLAGYLLTRIFLAVIIKSADTEVQYIRLESGKKVGIGELTRLQQTSLDDMRSTLAEMVAGAPGGERIAQAAPPPTPARRPPRVLWVDDRPANNVLLVEQLRSQNVIVREVLSTRDGLAALAGESFDLIISDMARTEAGVKVRDAGVRFVREVRAQLPDIPFYIFCGKNGATEYGAAAEAAGANLVTTSGTRLIAAVNKCLGLNA